MNLPTIADFLLARIAEDELTASEQTQAPWLPASRVLAECAAKRRIVEQWDAAQPPASNADQAVADELDLALMHLAAVYSDHVHYREEWKP